MANPKALKALQIRPAKESDIQHLVVLEEECFDAYYYSHYQFGEVDFYGYLQMKEAILVVATCNSSLIGYVAGSVRFSRLEVVAQLDSIAVSPAFRGKGVGDRLLHCFIEETKDRACKRVLLQVATDNNNGIAFFSRRGFQKIRYLPGYYGKRWDGVLMELKI